jgi:hypothetical protein
MRRCESEQAQAGVVGVTGEVLRMLKKEAGYVAEIAAQL